MTSRPYPDLPARASHGLHGVLLALMALLMSACGGEAASPLGHRFAQDHPSVASRSSGGTWIAHEEWRGTETRLVVRPLEVGPSGEQEDVAETIAHTTTGRVLGTALAADTDEVLHLLWSEQRDGRFVIDGLTFTPEAQATGPGVPGVVTRVVDVPGANAVRPVLVADDRGGLLLVWTQIGGLPATGGEGGLRLMARGRPPGGDWGPAAEVSHQARSNWSPSAVASGPGAFAVVWDAAVDGDYDVLLARLTLGADGRVTVAARHRVTDSPRAEGHPSVAAHGDRLYVAYDVGPEDWGREGSVNKLEVALHMNRTLEVVAVEGERVAPVAHDVMAGMSPGLRNNVDQPRLMVDGTGNLVLLFRGMPLPDEFDDPTSEEFQARMTDTGGGKGWRATVWFTFVTRCDQRGWLLPGGHRMIIEESAGRLDAPAALGRLPRGGVAFAVVGDGRKQLSKVRIEALGADDGDDPEKVRQNLLWWWQPVTEEPTRVSAHRLMKGAPTGPLPVGDWRPLPALRAASPADAPLDVTRPGPGGETLRLAFGDLHRHTDISRCSMNWDGSVSDAFRYAYDAGPLQFLAVTDHFEHMTAYDWWRTATLVDAFDLPGRMVNLRAYERSSAETGHRNVIARGGDLPLIAYPGYHVEGRDQGVTGDDDVLAPYFHAHDVITIPHTPAGMASGADVRFRWGGFDPDLDRVVEVFQGYRGSSEAFGEDRVIPNLVPWYHVRPHLDRDLHFGLIASSDHQSSDGAFAGAWVSAFTRDGIFDALKERRTFGSTVRVALWAEWNGVPMGTSAVGAAGPGTFRVEVDGRGRALERLDLIVDGAVSESRLLTGDRATVEFALDVPADRSRYAYARVVLAGDELAWSSPVRLAPDAAHWDGSDGLSGAAAMGRHGPLEQDWVARHGEMAVKKVSRPSAVEGAHDAKGGDGAAGDGAAAPDDR